MSADTPEHLEDEDIVTIRGGSGGPGGTTEADADGSDGDSVDAVDGDSTDGSDAATPVFSSWRSSALSSVPSRFGTPV